MAATSVERAEGAGKFRPSSSIAGDAWHGEAPTPAYEWWYFDALSQDGRDALVVIFLTNFIFSPRYNRAAAESFNGALPPQTAARFPAVAVFFYRDGRPLFRAINEYTLADFQASATRPECRIGRNTFRLVEDGAEPLYELRIDTALRRRKLLQAKLSWAVKEGDFFKDEKASASDSAAHQWNMVAPRCDVSGEVTLSERDGARSFEQDFHGTGYHDHNRDTRWMPATIAEWQWGRIHFPETTAVFYRYRERDETESATRLYLIQDNSPVVFAPQVKLARTRQHHFGPRYPSLLTLHTAAAVNALTLSIRQQRVIDSSFFYLRFLSEATLEIEGRARQRATGITEHLAPRSLSYGWLHWLINMRIGRNDRGAFLP
ncbi:MAG TPA: hypothetical protein VGC89_14345 [Pyrinomonadaceae bacterium]